MPLPSHSATISGSGGNSYMWPVLARITKVNSTPASTDVSPYCSVIHAILILTMTNVSNSEGTLVLFSEWYCSALFCPPSLNEPAWARSHLVLCGNPVPSFKTHYPYTWSVLVTQSLWSELLGSSSTWQLSNETETVTEWLNYLFGHTVLPDDNLGIFSERLSLTIARGICTILV